jgi:cardiolipin synthase
VTAPEPGNTEPAPPTTPSRIEIVARRRRRRETATPTSTAIVHIPTELRRYTTDLARWRGGNQIRQLVSGRETFPAMLGAIAGARHSICLETYIYREDRTGRRFAEALMERARAGVAVRLIVDAIGSFTLAAAFLTELREAGVEVVEFHPIAPWRQRWSLSRRNHRKILVVDDEVGFTGGLNIADDYADVEDGGAGWRDTHCELRGPIVADLARSFRRMWINNGGTDYKAPPRAELVAPSAGKVLARLLDNTVRKRRRRIRRAYLAAITGATREVLIANAYFIPDRGVRAALRRAVRRGVSVRIIVPGRSDVRLIELASLLVLRRLARAGVRFFRWRGAMLHAKTAVIDGTWSTIGSYNLDNISLFYNLEDTVECLDAAHGAAMVRQFELDAANADPFDETTWRQLPWWKKAGAWLAYQFRRWL